MADSLETFLAAAPPSTVVVVGRDATDLVPEGRARVVVLPEGADPDHEPWELAVVVARDRLDLRALAARCPGLGRAGRVAVWLAAGGAVLPRPVGLMPAITDVRSRRLADGSWLSVLGFAAPVSVARVLGEVARQAVRGDDAGDEGLWADTAAATGDAEVPVSVVLGEAGEVAVHPVLGRAPVVLAEPDPVPCLDERVLNPHGFRADRASAPVALGAGVVLSEGLVAELREAASVSVTWPEIADPALLRTVAGLAMSGVVLTSAAVPRWAAGPLGDGVVAALTATLPADDLLAREEHSLVLRRAALDRFSARAWRRRTAARAGIAIASDPSVSVVLATKRADMLAFALGQVARQRGLPLELVLAPHGFAVDESAVRGVLGDGVSLVLRPQPEDVPFGDVLNAAAEATSGDLVLKMDDDDWYSPDAVADLVRAHHYSGAEVVGMPAEFHYLTGPGLTVTRGHTTEVYARFVAGGTLMLERSLLREVGGFRSVRKFVDAQLLAATAAAGATLYRTHGLGYVLRRNPSGHTWEVDLDYLLDPVRTQRRWEGFRPSRLMEL